MAQHLDGRLAYADSLQTAAWFHPVDILPIDESLCNLGPFEFFVPHLFSMGRGDKRQQ